MSQMTPEDALAFLAAGAPTAAVATTRPDGSPHVVPVWFVVDGRDLVFTCAGDSVKARNLRHDPRVAISADDDDVPCSCAGLSGTAEIAERPPDLLAWTTRIA